MQNDRLRTGERLGPRCGLARRFDYTEAASDVTPSLARDWCLPQRPSQPSR
jgi:hypothetical protein